MFIDFLFDWQGHWRIVIDWFWLIMRERGAREWQKSQHYRTIFFSLCNKPWIQGFKLCSLSGNKKEWHQCPSAFRLLCHPIPHFCWTLLLLFFPFVPKNLQFVSRFQGEDSTWTRRLCNFKWSLISPRADSRIIMRNFPTSKRSTKQDAIFTNISSLCT